MHRKQAVCPGGYSCLRHGFYEAPYPGAVARIHHDREVAHLLEDWDRREIQCEPRELPVAPYPPLAEDDVGVPAVEYVLSGAEPFIDR